jgi:hypothetical protein
MFPNWLVMCRVRLVLRRADLQAGVEYDGVVSSYDWSPGIMWEWRCTLRAVAELNQESQ